MVHMVTAFFIGNIASGKSTATRYLESLGARRIDLDDVAKNLYVPGSPLVAEIAQQFGWDVLDECGGVKHSLLAARAFCTPEATETLNAIVHPAVRNQLAQMLLPTNCCSVMVPEFDLTVVEVSVPAAVKDTFVLADAVVAVTAPLDVRRERAIGRGMSLIDFENRVEHQPSEEELCRLATFVIDNTSADQSLYGELDRWLLSVGLDSLVKGGRSEVSRHV